MNTQGRELVARIRRCNKVPAIEAHDLKPVVGEVIGDREDD